MNKEYKVSVSMKITFIASIFILVLGFIQNKDIAVVAGMINLVVLSVGIEILESIHNSKFNSKDLNNEPNQ